MRRFLRVLHIVVIAANALHPAMTAHAASPRLVGDCVRAVSAGDEVNLSNLRMRAAGEPAIAASSKSPRTTSQQPARKAPSKTAKAPPRKETTKKPSSAKPATAKPPAAKPIVLAWPVSGRTIVQAYGERVNPATGTVTLNPGINIAATGGSEVRAAAGGKVTLVSWMPSYGTFVIVQHRDGYRTVYANLAKTAVKRGSVVKTGSRLGTIGSRRRFLHFEVWRNQVRLDPATLLPAASASR